MVKIDDRLLFGLYSWKSEKPNFRDKELPKDPRDGTNEFNHIRNAGTIGKTVIEHLKSKCLVNNDNIEYYKDINSFKFVPIDGLDINDIETVQEMINLAYHVKSDENEKEIPWSKLAILQKRTISGYSDEISKKILDDFAAEHKKLVEQTDVTLSDEIKHLLEIQSKRTCEKIHTFEGQKDTEVSDKRLLLQDLLIPGDNKQFILSSIAFGKTLKNNNKIIINPWNSKFDWGYYVFNIQINKASISCIINNSEWLLPIRIIFDSHPKRIYYENQFKEIQKDNIEYIGFFLIRYKFDETGISDCENINNIQYFKAHESKEQYYVMLVFKNTNDEKKKCIKIFLIKFQM
jgi:hypothetical protein